MSLLRSWPKVLVLVTGLVALLAAARWREASQYDWAPARQKHGSGGWRSLQEGAVGPFERTLACESAIEPDKGYTRRLLLTLSHPGPPPQGNELGSAAASSGPLVRHFAASTGVCDVSIETPTGMRLLRRPDLPSAGSEASTGLDELFQGPQQRAGAFVFRERQVDEEPTVAHRAATLVVCAVPHAEAVAATIGHDLAVVGTAGALHAYRRAAGEGWGAACTLAAFPAPKIDVATHWSVRLSHSGRYAAIEGISRRIGAERDGPSEGIALHRVWDLSANPPRLCHALAPRSIFGPVLSAVVAFAPDEQQFLEVGRAGTLALRETATGLDRWQAQAVSAEAIVRQGPVVFTADRVLLVARRTDDSGDPTPTLVACDRPSGRVLWESPLPVFVPPGACWVDPTGRWLALHYRVDGGSDLNDVLGTNEGWLDFSSSHQVLELRSLEDGTTVRRAALPLGSVIHETSFTERHVRLVCIDGTELEFELPE